MTIGTASRSLIIVVLALLTVPQVAADSAVVLMYHRFGEDRFPSTNIRVEQFEAQLEHLQEAGYTIVPLADVVSALTQGTPLPDRAVAVSIDDAYRSVYDVAFPRLSAPGYPFTAGFSGKLIAANSEIYRIGNALILIIFARSAEKGILLWRFL